jgi:hypothetical protein
MFVAEFLGHFHYFWPLQNLNIYNYHFDFLLNGIRYRRNIEIYSICLYSEVFLNVEIKF